MTVPLAYPQRPSASADPTRGSPGQVGAPSSRATFEAWSHPVISSETHRGDWSGIQLPWKPSGIRAGRRVRATGWLVKSCAARMTRSAAPRSGVVDEGHDVAVVLGGVGCGRGEDRLAGGVPPGQRTPAGVPFGPPAGRNPATTVLQPRICPGANHDRANGVLARLGVLQIRRARASRQTNAARQMPVTTP